MRTYLAEFLWDRRIVDLPRWLWFLILHGIILRIRPAQSAKKYASIWTKQGSPLRYYVRQQAEQLQHLFARRCATPIQVVMGMRYGQPSIAEAIQTLRERHCEHILLFPLYPQYAASSTASALDAVWRILLKMRRVPSVRSIMHYHDHPAYIDALSQQVQSYWQVHGKPTVLLMSFHGVPEAHLAKGDPYHCLCHKTARLLAASLNLSASEYRVVFQSRFGRQAWLQPYLNDTLQALGQIKVPRVDVLCPGFSSDCLETLEEVAILGKQVFVQAGGGDYHAIPALNDHPAWIEAMLQIALENLGGWLNKSADQLTEEALESKRLAEAHQTKLLA